MRLNEFLVRTRWRIAVMKGTAYKGMSRKSQNRPPRASDQRRLCSRAAGPLSAIPHHVPALLILILLETMVIYLCVTAEHPSVGPIVRSTAQTLSETLLVRSQQFPF